VRAKVILTDNEQDFHRRLLKAQQADYNRLKLLSHIDDYYCRRSVIAAGDRATE